MNNLTINFNGQNYIATYNTQTGYFEVNLKAPTTGGIYNADITFTDLFGQTYADTKVIQVLAKQPIKLEMNKVFIWIFDYKDFSIKDIIELQDYEINIDEETNSNTVLTLLKKTTAKSRDIVIIKKNNEFIYWGIIDDVENEDGKQEYQYKLKYITNMFNQNIKLENENLIKTTGVEDFIARAITDNFISNTDTFINRTYLQLNIKTHTPKQTNVSNVQDNIYNLHTWMTNCTQSYDITYNFEIVNKKLVITIENKTINKELIDVNAQAISNYTEVFETDIISKVVVLTNTDPYTLYLLNDRTTTTDMANTNRADGKVETVYTDKIEDAPQKALDTIKANAYNHMITFNMFYKNMQIGTPICIKTKESIILDSYISAIKITPKKYIEYTCGNIRIKFIDKLLKERNK